MTLGYRGYARKYSEDDTHIIYEYSIENWNRPYRHEDQLFDGLIVMDKSTFVEPEIHEKLKKMPSGRKRLITKKILVRVDVWKLIKEGKIEIQNSSRAWKKYYEIDYYAVMLCDIIYTKYQETGLAPEMTGFIQ